MNKITLKLKRVDPVKWGIIVGSVYALLSLVIIIPMFLFMSIAGISELDNSGMGMLGGGVLMLFAPVLYAIIGFIIGLISALILNFVLKKTNGLDLDFEKTGLDISQIGNDSI